MHILIDGNTSQKSARLHCSRSFAFPFHRQVSLVGIVRALADSSFPRCSRSIRATRQTTRTQPGKQPGRNPDVQVVRVDVRHRLLVVGEV